MLEYFYPALVSRDLTNATELYGVVSHLREDRGVEGQFGVHITAFLEEIGHFTCEDQAVEGAVEHPIDAESVYAHSLNGRVTAVLDAVLFMIGVEGDCLGLFLCDNLADRAVFGKATIALFHLLHDAELLSLRDRPWAQPLEARITQIFELHVLDYRAIEPY